MSRAGQHRAIMFCALAALALLATPPLRDALEASMARQMLAQFSLLAAIGWVLAGALPRRVQDGIQAFNGYGVAGLTATAVILGVLMIPRVLDLALVDVRIEIAKWLALLASGAALRLSWRRAGLLVQGFFLGNTLPMMAVAGQLYQDSPLRLCNAYLLDDQVRLGRALVALAVTAAAVWIAGAMRTLASAGATLPLH